jgi:hypothetical protein
MTICWAATKVNEQSSRLIQLIAFKCGVDWGFAKEPRYTSAPYLCRSIDGTGTLMFNGSGDLGSVHLEFTNEQFIEHLVTGKVTWEVPKKELLVNVGAYTASVIPGESIKAGCVDLDAETVEKLIKAWSKKYGRIAVKVDVNQSRLIQLAANKLGFTWSTKKVFVPSPNTHWLYLDNWDNKRYAWDDQSVVQADYTDVRSFNELMESLLCDSLAPAQTIQSKNRMIKVIAGESVEFAELTLNKDQVNELIKAWKDK